MSDDLDQQLSDLHADGRITDEDVYHVQKFREFLRVAGPARGPLTPEQRAQRRAVLNDPEWRDWLGLNDVQPPPT